GVDVNDVTVIHGDTAIVQYGIGTFGSRGLAVGGSAVYLALQKVREKANKIAAHMLECETEHVSFKEGKFSRHGAKAMGASVPSPVVPDMQAPAGALPEPHPQGKHVTIQDVALAAHIAKNLPPDMEPGLAAI